MLPGMATPALHLGGRFLSTLRLRRFSGLA